MNVKKTASAPSLKSDLRRVDVHRVRSGEYAELPELDEDMLARGRFKRAGRGRIYDSIVDTLGDTPLVRLPNLTAELKPKGEVLAKLE